MNGRYLLDTNIVIALFDGDAHIIERINQSEEVYIPVFVLGELFYGAYKSTKQIQNLKQIEEFQNQLEILECDKLTAKYYGEIKNDLRKKGKPIPENDIWISALAAQHQLTVVTRDKHFENVDMIKTEKW
jgi:tRNA(fMet)-specific endonuclease VapC